MKCVEVGAAAMATAEEAVERQFLTNAGPQAGVTYPYRVIYCGGDCFILNLTQRHNVPLSVSVSVTRSLFYFSVY